MSRINRKKKEHGFVLMDKGFLNNPNLSMKAKGLLAYILGLPDDWIIYKSELPKHFKDGRDAIRETLKELERNGYVTQDRKKRDKRGRMTNDDITVHETPIQPRSVHVGLSATVFPQRITRSGKSNTTNINLTKNYLTKIDLTKCTRKNDEKTQAQNTKNQNPKKQNIDSIIRSLQSQGFRAIDNPTFLNRFTEEYKDYPHDLMVHLMEIAVQKKVKSFTYLATILKSWDDEGIKSVEQLKQKEASTQNKKNARKEPSALERRARRMGRESG